MGDRTVVNDKSKKTSTAFPGLFLGDVPRWILSRWTLRGLTTNGPADSEGSEDEDGTHKEHRPQGEACGAAPTVHPVTEAGPTSQAGEPLTAQSDTVELPDRCGDLPDLAPRFRVVWIHFQHGKVSPDCLSQLSCPGEGAGTGQAILEVLCVVDQQGQVRATGRALAVREPDCLLAHRTGQHGVKWLVAWASPNNHSSYNRYA